MKRNWVLAVVACLSATAIAQDIRIRGDLSFGMTTSNSFSLGGKSYTPLGRYSSVSLSGYTPLGLRVAMTQRVQVIPNDIDRDPFDEYFIEDEGSWRVGKQILPFGNGAFLRQSILAARLDSSLLIDGVPIAVAFADGGSTGQEGIIGRLGGRGFGISFATGRHWGINAQSLALVQDVAMPEGKGNGWQQAFGIDVYRRSGKYTYRTEGVVLRQPEGTSVEREIIDFLSSYDLGHRHSVYFGVTRDLSQSEAFWRYGGVYNAAKGVQVEALHRTKGGQFRDFSVFLRLRF
ncbi:MAG TPA: hypothetical protein VK171_10685 [Fimbriimonas sp.]|nr:hypothetical protein [Fimbriimonas sp.]